MKEKIEALYTLVVADVPVLLWGPPGVGKTATLTALAQRLGWHLEVVIGAVRDRTDFGGFPVVREGRVELEPLPWVRRLLEAGEGSILFLDELSSTPEDVRPALLRLIHERVAGDVQLKCRIVAAANPPSHAVGGFELEPPLANRLAHLGWDPDPRWIAQGFLSGWEFPPLPPIPPEEQIQAKTREIRALVGTYLMRNPSDAISLPKDESAGRAWPSPRSWDMLAKALGAARAMGMGEAVEAELAQATVGKEGLAFLHWVREMDLPDPEEVLRNPSLLPDRDDRMMASLAGLVSLVTANWNRANWEGAWRVLLEAARRGKKDVGAPMAGALIRAYIRAREERRPTWDFPREVLEAYRPLVERVGKIRQEVLKGGR